VHSLFAVGPLGIESDGPFWSKRAEHIPITDSLATRDFLILAAGRSEQISDDKR
jgi:hypothetical protein